MSLWSRIERRLTDLADELRPDELRPQLLDVQSLLSNHEIDEAYKRLQTLVRQHPQHPQSNRLLGIVLLELERPKDAIEALDRAIANGDESAETRLAKGQGHRMLQEDTLAVTEFEQARDRSGGNPTLLCRCYRGMGECYRAMRNFDKALRELRKAVAEQPHDIASLAWLSETLTTGEVAHYPEGRELAKRSIAACEADNVDAPAITWLALGRCEMKDRAWANAYRYLQDAFHTVAQQNSKYNLLEHSEVRVTLGDIQRHQKDHQGALQHYTQVLEWMPQRSDLHARIAQLHIDMGEITKGLVHYEHAAEFGTTSQILCDALAVALEHDVLEAAVRFADKVLTIVPEHPTAHIAKGLALARSGDTKAATGIFHKVLDQYNHYEAHIALGNLALEETPPPYVPNDATHHAMLALRHHPNQPRGRILLAQARAQQYAPILTDSFASSLSDQNGFHQLATAVHEIATQHPLLGAIATEAHFAAEDFDRPLLVTVMGEFSSGKSTLINAFLEQDAAPTSITPTTATINLVKFGRKRAGRIIYRDGHSETFGWDSILEKLAQLTPQQASIIQLVELLLPLPELERVNLVDTPGLNSILPEHEQIARAFIRRADAIIWVFSAGQTAKKSEATALQDIHRQGKQILGVLNKVDQLTATEIEEVTQFVHQQLGDTLEAIIPASTKQARDFQRRTGTNSLATDQQVGLDGNWSKVVQALETRFFNNARTLKYQQCNRRLTTILSRAQTRITDERTLAQTSATTLHNAADDLSEKLPAIIDDCVAQVRRQLNHATVELYRQAAQEVLQLVRPRQLPFGSHQAAPADRDYLIAFLDTGYETALAINRKLVVNAIQSYGLQASREIRKAVTTCRMEAIEDMDRSIRDAMQRTEANVFDRISFFLRGYVRGGYIDTFFRRTLAKIELSQEAVYQALIRDAPNIDTVITAPLVSQGTVALETIAERLKHWAAVADVQVYDCDVGIGKVLSTLHQYRLGLAGKLLSQ